MTGLVTISIEVELGWGYHDIGQYPKLTPERDAETRTLSKFLRLCDDLDIPITFDVVGHLLLEECDGDHKGPHRDGWFSEDPGTNTSEDPLFYAPDLVRQIIDARVDHDVGSHTFSHILFDKVTPSVVEWELNRVKKVHEQFGLDAPVSLVPPRNQKPPIAHIKSHGIKVVRQTVKNSPDSNLHQYFWNLYRSSPIISPRINEGIIETYVVDGASLTAGHLQIGQKPTHFTYRPLPIRLRQAIQERTFNWALEKCIRNDTAVHFWTHLHDMANASQWSLVERALAVLAEERNKNNVKLRTMKGLINEFREGAVRSY